MKEADMTNLDNQTLEDLVRKGGKDARFALRELSGRAFGDGLGAREVLSKLESEFRSGTLVLPAEIQKPKRNPLSNLIGKFQNVLAQAGRSLPPDRDP